MKYLKSNESISKVLTFFNFQSFQTEQQKIIKQNYYQLLFFLAALNFLCFLYLKQSTALNEIFLL